MISVLDYGIGNLASVMNALRYIGVECEPIESPRQVKSSGRLLLPGVGAFEPAITRLRERGLDDALVEHARIHGRPLLGICLGMQLLLGESAESGRHRGLGLIDGVVRNLGEIAPGLVVPHVGWNDVVPTRPSRLLGEDSPVQACYFVHGYYCDITDAAHVAGQTSYGSRFASVLEAGNVYGCQFHPEKSQRAGLAMLRRFAEL